MNENSAKKKVSIVKLVLAILLIAVLIYILFQVVMVIKPSIKTRTAIKYDLNDEISCVALMAMPQEEVFFNGGVPDYLVSNGDKVAAGSALARIFSSTEQALNYTQAQRIEEEVNLLKSAQLSTPGVNIEALLLQSQASLFSIIEKADSGNYLNIPTEKSRYQSAVNKTQISTGKMQSFEERINLLESNESALMTMVGDAPVIYAPKNGYFVSSKYSQSQQYTHEELKAMSPSELSQASGQQPVLVPDNLLGRLIYDYKWDCYLSVTADQAKKFIEGKTVYISFSEASLNKIPAKITAVNIDDNTGTAKITVSGDYMTSEIAAIQHTKATVIFPCSSSSIAYTGIRIPKEALRVINGEYGVFIRYGNLAQYKKIQIMFENENYILAPLTYEYGKNELKMYDEIIIEGRGLLPKAQSTSDSVAASDSSAGTSSSTASLSSTQSAS